MSGGTDLQGSMTVLVHAPPSRSQTSPKPPPIFLLHVSSAGGSSICRWAQQQRCSRIPSCGSNCNLGCAHPWDWKSFCRMPACSSPSQLCRPPYKAGCSGLQRYVQRNNITFFASETMLQHDSGQLHGHLCPGFRYVVLLRDPVERLRRQVCYCEWFDLLLLLQKLLLCCDAEYWIAVGHPGALSASKAAFLHYCQLERMSPQPNMRLRTMLASPYMFNASERTSLMGTPALNNYLSRREFSRTRPLTQCPLEVLTAVTLLQSRLTAPLQRVLKADNSNRTWHSPPWSQRVLPSLGRRDRDHVRQSVRDPQPLHCRHSSG